jgi:hypothetical protein
MRFGGESGAIWHHLPKRVKPLCNWLRAVFATSIYNRFRALRPAPGRAHSAPDQDSYAMKRKPIIGSSVS